MATTYFGPVNADGTLISGDPAGDEHGSAGLEIGSKAGVYTCPGSGAQTLTELGYYLTADSEACLVKLALYSADRSTVIAYTDSMSVPAGTGWKSVTGASLHINSAPVGGTNYSLHIAFHDNLCYVGNRTVTSGDAQYKVEDYSLFPPTPLDAGTSYHKMPLIRAGIDVTAGGGESTPSSFLLLHVG